MAKPALKERISYNLLLYSNLLDPVSIYGLFDIKDIKIVLEYCHLKWLWESDHSGGKEQDVAQARLFYN